jgi:hypothetical protein
MFPPCLHSIALLEQQVVLYKLTLEMCVANANTDRRKRQHEQSLFWLLLLAALAAAGLPPAAVSCQSTSASAWSVESMPVADSSEFVVLA